MDISEIIGCIAAVFTTGAFVPQVVKTIKTSSAEDFSIITLITLFTGMGLWLIYGLLKGATAVWIANAISLTLIAIITIVKIKNK